MLFTKEQLLEAWSKRYKDQFNEEYSQENVDKNFKETLSDMLLKYDSLNNDEFQSFCTKLSRLMLAKGMYFLDV